MSTLTDPARLDALKASGLLERSQQERLRTLTRVAATALRCAGAELNLITATHQVYVSTWPPSTRRQVTLDQSGCKIVVETGQPLLVPDASKHPVFCDFVTVRTGVFKSYIGVPIFFDHQAIGSLCALDDVVREWGWYEEQTLIGLARLAGLAID